MQPLHQHTLIHRDKVGRFIGLEHILPAHIQHIDRIACHTAHSAQQTVADIFHGTAARKRTPLCLPVVLAQLFAQILKFRRAHRKYKRRKHQRTLQRQQITHAGHAADQCKHEITDQPDHTIPLHRTRQPHIQTEKEIHDEHMKQIRIAHHHMGHHRLRERQKQQCRTGCHQRSLHLKRAHKIYIRRQYQRIGHHIGQRANDMPAPQYVEQRSHDPMRI